MLQIEAVTRTVDGTVEAAAKLRHDGCTGKIVLVTYQSVSLQPRLCLKCGTHDAQIMTDSMTHTLATDLV